MKLSDLKLKTEDFNGRDVSSLPDRPTLSSYELKARFDSPAKVVVGGRFNQLIDALTDAGVGEPSIIGDGGEGGSVVLELPVASGETLNTPCAVTIGKGGVRTPKYGYLRGSAMKGQAILENANTAFSGFAVTALFGNYVIASYSKRVGVTLAPAVYIAEDFNGVIMPKHLIHMGDEGSLTAKVPVRLAKADGGVWLLSIVEPAGGSFIYAFTLTDGIYNEIAKYTGPVSSGIIANRFCFMPDGTALLKYADASDTYGIAVKFTGSSFVSGTPQVIYNGVCDYPGFYISPDRYILRTDATEFRVLTLNGVNITAGEVLAYGKTAFGFAGVSRSRFAAFSAVSPNIECAFMNVSEDGVITAEAPQTLMSYAGGTPAAVTLSDEYIQIIYNFGSFSVPAAKYNSVFRVTSGGVKLMSGGAWPRLTLINPDNSAGEPIPRGDCPYTIAENANTTSTTMQNGLVTYGSYLEQVGWLGIALSSDGGKARVLAAPGAVTGFVGLIPGKAYAVGIDGQLCDAGDHPLALRAGAALDERTLWFTGV
ncbi:MAG: hypothetical protein FWG36_06460 [Oscillospiraceae bacterium]|nr:hypothetical protein [Oscillospiraceae bacterium]